MELIGNTVIILYPLYSMTEVSSGCLLFLLRPSKLRLLCFHIPALCFVTCLSLKVFFFSSERDFL